MRREREREITRSVPQKVLVRYITSLASALTANLNKSGCVSAGLTWDVRAKVALHGLAG